MSGFTTMSGQGAKGGRSGPKKASSDKADPGRASKAVRKALEQQQRRRRRRVILVSSIAAGVILIGALIEYGVYSSQTSSGYRTPAHASDAGAGIVAAGTGKTRVDMYVDYQCPICKAFEESASATLDGMVARKQITLIYHPVAFLDRMSSTQYSTRASASSGCASDLDHFLPYTQALFAQQPPEGSAGLSDDQLIQIGGQVGMIDPKFARCVRDGKYRTWVAHVTDYAARRHVTGTPTVLVNGKSVAPAGVAPTVADLTAAVNAAR